MLLVGIDWADAEHTYCVMDEAGRVVASGTIPHSPQGIDRLLATIRAHAAAPSDICVALETRHGPLVGTLLDQSFTVYAINPKAVDRHRERFRVAGAKSDLRDAWEVGVTARRLLPPVGWQHSGGSLQSTRGLGVRGQRLRLAGRLVAQERGSGPRRFHPGAPRG